MLKKSKKNKIIFLNAKKGSGKTILATALAYAQNKRVIWITPLKSGYYPHSVDMQQNEVINHPKQYNFFVVDAQGFAEKIQDILVFCKIYKEPIFLVVDELDNYVSSRLTNANPLFELVNQGRHYEIDMLFIARRNQDIPKSILTNVDFFICGANNLIENDLKYLRDFLTNEELELLKIFENGDFLEINCNTRERRKIHLTQSCVNKILSFEKNLIE